MNDHAVDTALTAAGHRRALVPRQRTDSGRPASKPVESSPPDLRGREHEPSIHDLVAAQAAAHPERIAVVGPAAEVTYGELDTRANRVAAHLRGFGVAAEVPVGVFLERSVEFVVTVLAILKAGGNYVPLDPGYPTARLDLMLQFTEAPIVVTSTSLLSRLPATTAAVLRVEELVDRPSSAGTTVFDRGHPDNLAYTMFTSGSTGVPKGVVVRHRGVVRLVQDPGYVRLDETEVVLHLSSTSFDAATFEIWGALANGARLVVAPHGRASVVELGALLREHAVTTAFLTTGLFHVMVDERLEDLSGLRQLVAGGDVMSPSRAHRFVEALPSCRLVNAYGPTEVTTFSTCHVVKMVPSAQESGFSVPIGQPIRKTWIRLLDDGLEPVPDGAPGHLYVGGDGLARGYLGDPALTAERFIPDPWADGERLYVTGDLARRRPDGTIEFLGRADQQVKKRGFRVEPAEIEEALRRVCHLRNAAVVPEGDTADERVLVAYLVPQTPAAPARELVAAIRSRLRDRLPEYLIPDQWVVVDAFPLTANGKLDRRALADSATARLDTGETARAGLDPQTEVERALAAIWRTIFQVDWVGRHDDFFELGGHSLLASRMISRVRGTMGVEVPLTVVFDHPTVGQMAELIENAMNDDRHGRTRGSQGNAREAT